VRGKPSNVYNLPNNSKAKILCDEVPELNAYGYLIGEEGTEEFSISTGKVKDFIDFRKKRVNS
jgi:hypothetical protein